MPTSISSDRLAKLFDAAAEVVEQSDLHEVLIAIMHTAMDLTGAKYGAVGVLGSHGILRDFLHLGMPEDVVEEIGHLPRGEGLLGTITRERKTLRLDDLSSHPDAVGFPPGHPAMGSFIGVSLRAGDQVFGNLYLTDKEGGFDEVDEATVEALANVGGAAALSAQLHERLQRLAVLEDRERIARDVHDGVIQDIFAVGLGLQGVASRVNDRETREHVISSIAKLDECIASLRTFIFDLRKPNFHYDPVTEIQELIEELGEAYEVVPRLVVRDLPEDLDDQQSETLMAIIKEAVSNALRHSGSDQIQVLIDTDGDCINVVVSDRGVGFEPGRVARGMGLSNIERRAVEAGGRFAVVSVPGGGAEVRIVLPR